MPVLIVLIVVLGRQVRQRFRRVQEAFAAVSDRVQENISGIRVIKAYAQEDAEVDRFERLNQNMLDTNVRMVKASATMSPMVDLVFGPVLHHRLVYGSALVRSGAISLGEFVTFNGYLTLIVQPIRSIARVINILSRGMASLKRYNQIMAVPPMVVESVDNKHPQPLLGELEVRDLSFRYPYAPSLSLQNISFHLRQGKTLGILGHTGSGKTTLCNLLLKLYNPPEGSVLFDGVDIHNIPLDVLRDGIGYVPQDNFLFSATIGDNIRFFDETITQEQIELAAKQADIYDNIMEFPEGFNTMVGERGVTLSGGQKQRISIARALVKKPAPADPGRRPFRRGRPDGVRHPGLPARLLRGGHHRHHRGPPHLGPDALRRDHRAGRGRIVERGTHEELMARGGYYAQTAAKQADTGEEARPYEQKSVHAAAALALHEKARLAAAALLRAGAGDQLFGAGQALHFGDRHRPLPGHGQGGRGPGQHAI